MAKCGVWLLEVVAERGTEDTMILVGDGAVKKCSSGVVGVIGTVGCCVAGDRGTSLSTVSLLGMRPCWTEEDEASTGKQWCCKG